MALTEMVCPHCKKQHRDMYNISYYNQGDYFWCNYCGEKSIVDIIKKEDRKENKDLRWLRELTKAELKVYNDTDVENRNWLPSIKNDHIHFDILVLEKGQWNPMKQRYNFYETKRLLELMYHKCGMMPQVGDNIEGDKCDKDGKLSTGIGSQERFVIVSKGIGVDDFEEIQLYVVTEDRWLEKTGW